MFPLLLTLVVTATPFEPRDLSARGLVGAESSATFRARTLGALGTPRREVTVREDGSARVTWTVRLPGRASILGVACADRVFAWGDGGPDAELSSWGCRLSPSTARDHGLPEGVEPTFALGNGALRGLSAPLGARITLKGLSCRGELLFQDGVLTDCELAARQPVHEIALPAGTHLHFGLDGRLLWAAVRGPVQEIAGRTWHPDREPCGRLVLEFDADGGVVLPRPERSSQEVCCD